MPTLFDIGDDIRTLDSLLEEVGGELSDPRVEEAWAVMAAELAENEAAKLDGYVNWMRTLEMEAAAARAEAEQYEAKANSRENRIKWLKDRLKNHLEGTGRTKVETATRRVLSIQRNGGAEPVKLVDNLDPATLPDDLAIVKRSPDMDAIRKRLQAGFTLVFATLGERGTHLRIR